MDQLGLTAGEEQEAEILAEVKSAGIRKKGLLNVGEFRTIVNHVCGI